MTGFNSIGDVSRFSVMRQANAQLKTRLSTLSTEATTGLKSDIAAATGGNLGRLAQVETRLTLLDSYARNAAAAQGEMTGLQAAMETMTTIATARGPALLTAGSLADATSLHAQSMQAQHDFRTVAQMMNTEVGGRYLLAGTAVTTAPVMGPDEMLDALRATLSGMTDPADMIAAVDHWFMAEDGGFAASAFLGEVEPTTTGVGPGATVVNDLTAADPSFRVLLKGLALASLSGEEGLGLGREGKALLMNAAGLAVADGGSALTAARARLGARQEVVERAATRNAAEATALSIARSGIRAADPYETASALTQTEASLQNLYALTVRMSRLSLTEYLR